MARRPRRGDAQPTLFAVLDEAAAAPARAELPDAAARAYAVDPRNDVVLEASAGTGKTSVLVSRYLNLLSAGVDPANILAITFTRKAAAEMRDRIVSELRRSADGSPGGRARWVRLRDRLDAVAIGTIDAFCLSLLREFPLEANLDPGFAVADETEVARFVDAALDRTLRIARARAADDEELSLVFALLPTGRVRAALERLLDRRFVAAGALARYTQGVSPELTGAALVTDTASTLVGLLRGLHGGLTAFVESGPLGHPRFRLLAASLRRWADGPDGPASARHLVEQLHDHFLTRDGKPRKGIQPYKRDQCASPAHAARHADAVKSVAPAVLDTLERFDRDLNVILARAFRTLFGIAHAQYRRTLEEHDVVDFAEGLARAVALLRNMDEFSQSRFRLESRYHHVLVDEFQDTSRLQWELVSLLVQSWGEGAGLVHEAPLPPSIFIVGDRKQSIYRFRDADVAVLAAAGRFVAALRPDARPARWISKSFRAVPALLAFTNDLFTAVEKNEARADAFRYDAADRFPVDDEAPGDVTPRVVEPVVGLVATDAPNAAAEVVADETVRLLEGATVRDRDTGIHRRVQPSDIAILFRARETHRALERALVARRVPVYVYKGLGFFDADEIKDVAALLRYLARPESPARTAAFLRSRFVRLSDAALLDLRRDLPGALGSAALPAGWSRLGEEDRRALDAARRSAARWIALADRVPPAELLDAALTGSAYAAELRGPRAPQARENLKKMRALVRRLQNRGYATLGRVADHLERLSAGDESNAVVDAVNAVNLMTVHAAKGLEFPVVFLASVGRGTGGGADVVRVTTDGDTGESTVSVGAFRSEADEQAREQDREESKRLLYVAVTRARDRLYLCASFTAERFKPGRGSLGEVLPPSLLEAFVRARDAAPDVASITWHPEWAPAEHPLALCRAAETAAVADTTPRPSSAVATAPATITPDAVPGPGEVVSPAWPDCFEPLAPDPGARAVGVRDLVAPAENGATRDTAGDPSDVVAGRLVHRLFQASARFAPDTGSLRAIAGQLLTREERTSVTDTASLVDAAVETFRALRDRPDVVAWLSAGEVWYEVPFSMRLAPATGAASAPPPDTSGSDSLVHGAIDAIVRAADGRLTVLEIKTGRRAAWHEAQLRVYVEAAQRLFPGSDVQGMLIYPAGEPVLLSPAPSSL